MRELSESDAAALAEARALADQGDLLGAEHRFFELLARHRAAGSSVEALSCSSLVTLYGRQARYFEVVTLASHLRHLGGSAGDADALAYAAYARATAWINLHALDAAERELDALAALLPRLSQARGILLEKMYHQLRLRAALGRGDAQAATACFDRWREALARQAQPGAGDAPALKLREAQLQALRGNAAEGLALLDAAAALTEDGIDCAQIGIERLRLLRASGTSAELCAAGAEFVAFLTSLLAEQPFTSQIAADGARCLLDVLLAGERWVPEDWPAEILDRAWELGTTAVVRRHQELRRIVDDLPELTYTEPEDLERFRVLRAQNDGWRATLRPRIRRFLANRPRAEGPAVQAFTVCAWCDLVRVDPERWLPLLSSYDTVGAGLASHGICPACEEGLVQTPG